MQNLSKGKAINLTKGGSINLTKDDGSGLSKIRVGLGWKPVRRGFFSMFKAEIDIDASVFMANEDGTLIPGDKHIICFRNLSYGGCIIHHGDDTTGGSGDGGDDEEIDVMLADVPAKCSRLVFVANIYKASKKQQHFGEVENAYIRILDTGSKSINEICRFNLSGDYAGKTAIIVGEVCRSGNGWEFRAIGEGTMADYPSQLAEAYGTWRRDKKGKAD